MAIRITPIVKRRVAPLRNSIRRDIKEISDFYCGNAKKGWERGAKLVDENKIGYAPSFFVKALYAASRIRVRGKDVLPLVGCGLFSVTNPIIGMGLVGFALGKSANKVLSAFYAGIKASAAHMPPR